MRRVVTVALRGSTQAQLLSQFALASALTAGGASYHRDSTRTGSARKGKSPYGGGAAMSRKEASSSPPSSPAPSSSSSSPNEREIREMIWRRAWAERDWETTLSHIARHHRASGAALPAAGLPLWQELVIALLLAGRGESAFAAWQQGSAMGGAGAVLATPTTLALSLYSFLVDGNPSAATDLLLLFPQQPLTERDGTSADAEKKKKLVTEYVRFLCRLGRNECGGDSNTPAAAAEDEERATQTAMAHFLVSRLLDDLARSSPQTAQSQGAGAIPKGTPAALVLLLASLRHARRGSGSGSAQAVFLLEDWAPDDARAATLWHMVKNLTEAAAEVVASCWDVSAHHPGEQPREEAEMRDGYPGQRWVSLVADLCEPKAGHFLDLPSALLTTTAAVFVHPLGNEQPHLTSLAVFRAAFASLCSVAAPAVHIPVTTPDPTLASCLILSSDPCTGDGESTSFLHTLLPLHHHHHANGAPWGEGEEAAARCADPVPVTQQRVLALTQAPLPLPLPTTRQQDAVAATAKALVSAAASCSAPAGLARGRSHNALMVLSQLSLFLPPPAEGDGDDGALRLFGQHPHVVQSLVEAITDWQTQSWEQRGSGEAPRLELACREWRNFIHRLVSPFPFPSLRLPNSAVAAAAPHSGLSLPPATMAALHRTWWMPECLRLSPEFCHAYEQSLLAGAATQQGAGGGGGAVLCGLAQRVARCQVSLHNGDSRRVVALLVCRWAWIPACLDELGTGLATPASPRRLRATTLGEAVSQTLRRCRLYHRPDIAHELADLLLCPVSLGAEGDQDTRDSDTRRHRSSVLSELIRVLRETEEDAAASVSSPVVSGTVANLVREVCSWRPDAFSSFADLVDLWQHHSAPRGTREPHPNAKGSDGEPIPFLFSVVVMEALCPSSVDSPWAQVRKASAEPRALLAARLLCEGCTSPDRDVLATTLVTPEVLVSIGRALRRCCPSGACATAATKAYSEVMRTFLLRCSSTFPGPFGGRSAAEVAQENCLYAQQRMASLSPPAANTPLAAVAAWQRQQDSLRNRGRGMIASFALNYILMLWAWAHEATQNDKTTAATLRERARHLSRLLLSDPRAPPVRRAADVETATALYDSATIMLLLPPAEREALRLLFVLYTMHRQLSHGLTTGPAGASSLSPDTSDAASALATALIGRLPRRPNPRTEDGATQAVARYVDRICRHEAPELLGLYGPLAQQVALGLTGLHDALARAVPQQLPPMTRPRPTPTAGTEGAPTPRRRLSKAEINACMDAGDWVAALRAIPAAFTSTMHVVRKSLSACEAAQPHRGVAWQGAMAVWHYARQARDDGFRLGLPEAGRLATLLAHGRRWREALQLYHELDKDQIDGYVFSQVAFALRSNSSSGGAAYADAVVTLWADWRCRVGDAVAPTPAMVDAMLGAGLVGSQAGAATAACLLVKEAVTSSPPQQEQRPSPQIPGTELPLRLESAKTERAVQKLLRERWYESWQSALAVAVASGRPALVTTVASHSPAHKAIYRASTQAMRSRQTLAEMDPAQRAALARHVVSSRNAFSSSLAKNDGKVGKGQHPRHQHQHWQGQASKQQRAREEIENVEEVLKDLLGE